MQRIYSAIGILTSILLLLVGLVHVNLFGAATDAIDHLFDAPPKWTQVTQVYRDPRTQEISHGEDPQSSLTALKQYWHERPGARRIVFVGNSQMHAISLAVGEMPTPFPEKTYIDVVIQEIERSDPNEVLYRLSFSGMSYPEVLWELSYMLDDPDLRPDIVVLQMNYQAFWTGGVRDSMLPLLRRRSFRARVEALAALGRSYAAAYTDAMRRYDEGEDKGHLNSDVMGDARFTSIVSPGVTPGYMIETRVREWLDKLLPRENRAALQEAFVGLLYRSRLYLLRLKPSTARSITGSRLFAARSAIDSIGELCVRNNVQLVLFHAPVNPKVSLYRTEKDRESYREFVASIATKYGAPLFDFENSISSEHWGRLLNGPDPLHMGRTAHEQMARHMIDALKSVAITK